MSDKVFHIKTTKAIIFKSLLEVIKPYMKETNITINSSGIKIATMDIAKKCVTYVKLDAKKFEKYECSKPMVFGIDTTILFKSIKSATRRETLSFYMDTNDQENLNIELEDPFQGKIKSYKLTLLALENKNVNIQEMEFDSIISIPSIQFQHIIKDIDLLNGKIVEIKSIGKQLIFSCTDGDAHFKVSLNEFEEMLSSEQKQLLHQNGEDLKSVKFKINTDKIVQGTFSLSYLMNFIKASHLCDTMNILLSNDKPLVLQYFVADLGEIRFLLIGNFL
jgi:proliferating cell nuclear antigen